MAILHELRIRISASFSLPFRWGNSVLDSIKLFISPWWFLVSKVGIKNISPLAIVIKHRKIARKITLFSDENFLAVYEILCKKEYASSLVDPKIIVDIGANVGIATVYFSCLFPHSKIYSIEPDPTTFSRLQHQTSGLKQVHIWCGAVGAKDGSITFYSSRNSLSSSIYPRLESDKKINVSVISLDSFCRKNKISKIDFLKFDVEGAEWSIFSALPRININHFIGEYHQDLVGKSVHEFAALFPQYVITISKIHEHRFIIEGKHR